MPATETARVLATDDFADAVNEGIELARAFGAGGVPFFVIDRRYGVSGAQPPELFLEALQAAHGEAAHGEAAHGEAAHGEAAAAEA